MANNKVDTKGLNRAARILSFISANRTMFTSEILPVLQSRYGLTSVEATDYVSAWINKRPGDFGLDGCYNGIPVLVYSTAILWEYRGENMQKKYVASKGLDTIIYTDHLIHYGDGKMGYDRPEAFPAKFRQMVSSYFAKGRDK